MIELFAQQADLVNLASSLGIGGLLFVMWWKERADRLLAERKKEEALEEERKAVAQERKLALTLDVFRQLVEDNTKAMQAIQAVVERMEGKMEERIEKSD